MVPAGHNPVRLPTGLRCLFQSGVQRVRVRIMLQDDDFFFPGTERTDKARRRATRFAVLALAACIAMLAIVVAQVDAKDTSAFLPHTSLGDRARPAGQGAHTLPPTPDAPDAVVGTRWV